MYINICMQRKQTNINKHYNYGFVGFSVVESNTNTRRDPERHHRPTEVVGRLTSWYIQASIVLEYSRIYSNEIIVEYSRTRVIPIVRCQFRKQLGLLEVRCLRRHNSNNDNKLDKQCKITM